jgi:hypothetical protein
MSTHNHNTVSASTVIATTWSHLFKIDSYTRTKMSGPHVPAKTDRFPAGGHSWRISFYPDRGAPALVHLKLIFTCGYLKPPVNAIVRFTLLPRGGSGCGGEPLTLTRTFEPRSENPMVDMKKEDLEKYVGHDDSLAIRCDVRANQKYVVKFQHDLPKEEHADASSSSGSPACPSRSKTTLLGFTRKLLPACMARDITPPLPSAPVTPDVPAAVCVICFDALVDGETCSEMPACHHLYHKNCIDGWINSNNTCPMCRCHVVAGSERVVATNTCR